MDSIKEIGSYFELEFKSTGELHKDAIALNLGRNALRYIVRAHKIKKIFVPYYTCDTVWDALKAEKCEIIYYDVGKDFMPLQNFPEDDFILYTNYFGVCSNNVEILSRKHSKLIVDNTMAFYAQKKGIASFNSARKFFGVTDGAYVYSNKKVEETFKQDVSYERFIPCLKRIELGSDAGYTEFAQNEKNLCNQNIKTMSILTKKILSSIDYDNAKKIRLENLKFLHSNLNGLNELKLNLSKFDVPMKYPLMIKNNNLRKLGIENKIYLARYWGVDETSIPLDSTVHYFQEYLFPIPLDQRYNIADMQRIIEIIRSAL